MHRNDPHPEHRSVVPGAARQSPAPIDGALIVLGGDPLVAGRFTTLPRNAVVIAADSGVDQAHRLGLDVDVAIGDFDSVSAAGLERAVDHGADVHRHATAKDATDFELALEAALALGVGSATVLGGEGGRLDHLIANALVMASPRFEALTITALGSDGERIHIVRRHLSFNGTPGELVSLLAVNGPAFDVSTKGLRFALHGERLDPGSSRGVSNQLVAAHAEVSLGSGVLIAVLPGPRHTPQAPSETPQPTGEAV